MSTSISLSDLANVKSLGQSTLIEIRPFQGTYCGYQIRLYKDEDFVKNETAVSAHLYRLNSKICEYALDLLSSQAQNFSIGTPLPQEDANKLYRLVKEDIQKRHPVNPQKPPLHPSSSINRQKASLTSEDSDDELEETDKNQPLAICEKNKTVLAIHTTIPSKHSRNSQNIKGSKLIAIAHSEVRKKYDEIFARYLKRRLKTPDIEGGILSISDPRQWFMTLGGWWQNYISKAEISSEDFETLNQDTFNRVNLYEDTSLFWVENNRISFSEETFFIGNHNATDSLVKLNGEWHPTIKRDLSYNQIFKAIKSCKDQFNLTDAQIASIQLELLSGNTPSLLERIPEENRSQVTSFLHFLNALMFGVEASGANAALATSLITLRLIVEKNITYELAFKANQDGGVFPQACCSGGNRGTYSQRRELIEHNIRETVSYTMKEMRRHFSCPVAVKEAMLLKKWIVINSITSETLSYGDNLSRIEKALRTLLDYYFEPSIGIGFTFKAFLAQKLEEDSLSDSLEKLKIA